MRALLIGASRRGRRYKPAVARTSYQRWWIVVLLFFCTTILYVDRQLFANLVPYFEDELKIGPQDLAYINIAFQLTYGMSMALVGRFVDRVGVRVGLAITFLVWNLASAGHALIGSAIGFILIRVLLGLGEAGNFPASIRAIAEWFPRRERALATGWFNSGSNIGAVITPLLVPLIAIRFGWRACFAILGGVGIVWIFFWLRSYRSADRHPRVLPEELAHIRSDPPDTVGRIPALVLLGQRPVYGTSLARFFTEAPWWFYLFWAPKFLSDRFGMGDAQRAWAIATIFLVADFGAVGGGWVSSHLIRRGFTVNAARKTGMLIAAIGTLPVLATPWIDSAWGVVLIIALAAASHQAWSSNVYTVVSDTLPRSAVATTIGINMAFGAVGSSIFQLLIPMWLARHSNDYTLPLMLAGSLYFVGLLALHLVMPTLAPARVDEHTAPRVRGWHVAAAATILIAALVGLQSIINRPPYRSVDDYFAKRSAELHAGGYVEGASARVGWKEARWVIWQLPDGSTKPDLIKLDTAGRPTIESKGERAKKYVGPGGADEFANPSGR